ncbi:MAG TPA: carboxypeptidase-like regulatory domain-containing protein [Pyrinomonadaceae bacterium]|nr:carboxypeptidase-like regulatory domain-containing protein [Pyrinomonadaceae bacterium]
MARRFGRLLLVASALLLLALLAREAGACTCAGDRAPCQAYWQADAVFVGAVVGETKFTADEGAYKHRMRLVRLAVEQPLRGVEGSEVEVATGWGGGDCGYGFRQGRRYVVYARRGEKDGRLYTSICARTRPLEEAGEDLAFVRGLAAAEPTGTVFGQAHRRNYYWKEGENVFKPVAGAEVTVEGPDLSRELKTDAEGRFRLGGLAPGKYRVTMKVPPGLFYETAKGETRAVSSEVEVAARGCAQAEFYLEADTRVAGRVLEASGRPAADLRLQMRGAASDPRNINTFLYAKTDAEGRFEFKAVPPGEYLLGVRILGSVGEPLPYPRTYYPGTPSKEAASVVKVGEGERVGDLEMRLPPRLEEYEVTGTVVYEDGRPAPSASVYVDQMEDDRTGDHRSAQADESGRFAVKVYEGLNYKMSAYPRGATGPAAQSPWIDVPPPGARPVKLVLPVLKK